MQTIMPLNVNLNIKLQQLKFDREEVIFKEQIEENIVFKENY